MNSIRPWPEAWPIHPIYVRGVPWSKMMELIRTICVEVAAAFVLWVVGRAWARVPLAHGAPARSPTRPTVRVGHGSAPEPVDMVAEAGRGLCHMHARPHAPVHERGGDPWGVGVGALHSLVAPHMAGG